MKLNHFHHNPLNHDFFCISWSSQHYANEKTCQPVLSLDEPPKLLECILYFLAMFTGKDEDPAIIGQYILPILIKLDLVIFFTVKGLIF